MRHKTLSTLALVSSAAMIVAATAEAQQRRGRLSALPSVELHLEVLNSLRQEQEAMYYQNAPVTTPAYPVDNYQSESSTPAPRVIDNPIPSRVADPIARSRQVIAQQPAKREVIMQKLPGVSAPVVESSEEVIVMQPMPVEAETQITESIVQEEPLKQVKVEPEEEKGLLGEIAGFFTGDEEEKQVRTALPPVNKQPEKAEAKDGSFFADLEKEVAKDKVEIAEKETKSVLELELMEEESDSPPASEEAKVIKEIAAKNQQIQEEKGKVEKASGGFPIVDKITEPKKVVTQERIEKLEEPEFLTNQKRPAKDDAPLSIAQAEKEKAPKFDAKSSAKAVKEEVFELPTETDEFPKLSQVEQKSPQLEKAAEAMPKTSEEWFEEDSMSDILKELEPVPAAALEEIGEPEVVTKQAGPVMSKAEEALLNAASGQQKKVAKEDVPVMEKALQELEKDQVKAPQIKQAAEVPVAKEPRPKTVVLEKDSSQNPLSEAKKVAKRIESAPEQKMVESQEEGFLPGITQTFVDLLDEGAEEAVPQPKVVKVPDTQVPKQIISDVEKTAKSVMPPDLSKAEKVTNSATKKDEGLPSMALLKEGESDRFNESIPAISEEEFFAEMELDEIPIEPIAEPEVVKEPKLVKQEEVELASLEPKKELQTPPVAKQERPTDKAAAKLKAQLVIGYEIDDTDIPDSEKIKLADLAKEAGSADKRIIISTYASGEKDESKAANMISLSRGLSLRAFFIDSGVPMDRIIVQANGLENEGGRPDRAEISLD